MPTIINPVPVTAGSFGGMWITKLYINFNNDRQGFILANLFPTDGNNLLMNGQKTVSLFDLTTQRKKDAQLDNMLNALVAEAKVLRKAQMPDLPRQPEMPISDVNHIQILDSNPQSPVVVRVYFVDGYVYTVEDAFALSGIDPEFAQVFLGGLAEIARLAGLTVV